MQPKKFDYMIFIVPLGVLLFNVAGEEKFGAIFSAFVIFMLVRGILQTIFGKKNRQKLPDATPAPHTPPAEEHAEDSIAAELDRLFKKQEAPPAADKTVKQSNSRVNPKRSDAQRVLNGDKVVRDNEGRIRHDGAVRSDAGSKIHRDGEAPHDNSGRVHRDKEAFEHDKSKVYYDPRSDYNYDEERMNKEVAAFSLQHRSRFGEQQNAKCKLKHAALVNGFLMSEILGKPKGL